MFETDGLDRYGLPAWSRAPATNRLTQGQNGSATDAYLHIMAALYETREHWDDARYTELARPLAAGIREHSVRDNVLQPGDAWGPGNV